MYDLFVGTSERIKRAIFFFFKVSDITEKAMFGQFTADPQLGVF